VATVQVRLTNGRQLEIDPRFPPARLRHQYVWMRGFRYFLDFMPAVGKFREIQLFNRAGTLLYRDKSPQEF
jgi:hypothetical protein